MSDIMNGSRSSAKQIESIEFVLTQQEKGEKVKKTNELQVFSFEESEVKTSLIDNTPDVARILGYKNLSKATNDHCKKGTTT